MTIFDLIFLCAFLASAAALMAAGVQVLQRRFRQAAHIGILYGVCLALYLGVVIGVSLASPPRSLQLGEERCFDDWCMGIDAIAKSPANGPDGATQSNLYTVTLHIANRARRVAQSENGIKLALLDAQGQRFEALADPQAIPFNTRLEAGQAISLTRRFDATGAVAPLALAMEREGFDRFPGTFIIGDDSSLLHQPTILRLP